MNPIGNLPVILPALPVQISTPVSTTAPAAVLPTSGSSPTQTGYDPQTAEQQHSAAVQQASQQIANYYVLGDQTFTIFKDSTGQYITRYTNIVNGKVTYIPEPSLFQLGGSSSGDTPGIVKIEA